MAERSLALPAFPLAALAEALDSYPAADSAQLVAAFRRRVREGAFNG